MYNLKLWAALALGSITAACCQFMGTTNLTFPLQENVNTPALFPMPTCGHFNLEEATIDQMQQAMRNGTLTSQQLVLCYMQRTYQTEEYLR